MQSERVQNNQILKKEFFTMLPACLACAFVDKFIFMIDTLLSGFILGSDGIAAVAIGLPSDGLGLAFLSVIIKGAALQIWNVRGKARRRSS